MKWYSKDAFGDTNLRLCKPASRGIWYDMLWIMDASPRRGYLCNKSGPISDEQLCKMMGLTQQELDEARKDLFDNDVPSVEEGTGIWYNRRMVADEKKREVGSYAGSVGGGNPALRDPLSPVPSLSTDTRCLETRETIKVDCSLPIKVNNGLPIKVNDDFDEIWKEYPDKAGKSRALSAYEKWRKAGDTKEEILTGLRRYVEYVRHRQKTDFRDLKFKNGGTWFHQRGWKDEYTIDAAKPKKLGYVP